jgi:orotidine-5'-phosphate decarboxylase
MSNPIIAMSNPIIYALDHSDQSDAIGMSQVLAGHVGMFKVGLELFSHAGPDVVREILRWGDVMLDLKLNDIPNTVAGAAAAVRRQCAADWTAHRDYAYRASIGGQVRFLTVHASAGRLALHQAVEATEGRFGILAITVLTSLGREDLDELGVPDPVQVQVERLAALAFDAGCAGVVCAPTDVARLREALRSRPRGHQHGSFCFVCPGIRPAGAGTDDQNRIATPAAAIAAGADRLVVGRPIGRADDPRAAADAIAAEAHTGWASRR